MWLTLPCLLGASLALADAPIDPKSLPVSSANVPVRVGKAK